MAHVKPSCPPKTHVAPLWACTLGASPPLQWRIQKILVGGDLKHKTSKIRMSSSKLRLIFRPKSEIQTFFSPKFRWSPKKKKKKKVFTKIETDFSAEIKFRWSPKKKKKKRSSPKLRLIFRPKSEIQTFFSPKFRWSPKKKKKKKKRSSPKLRLIFRRISYV